MRIEPGARVGPYEIVSAIGAGGMGEVYKARDTRLDRIVAIKTLSPAVTADPAFHERFDREARAISQLSHPHICTLHDVGSTDGAPYLVLEYLEGQTLADRLTRGALPLDQALTIGAQICDALDNAHRQGIVHRDLKPANVMLTKGGAKLLDFGLAKPASAAAAANVGGALTVSARLTAEGTLLGTLQYMAPEQVEGREADARSDIFAVGAVLHEMVSGKRAFEGKTAASLIAAILERQPPPLSSLQALSPPTLDHIVARCLAKDPDERWQSAGDVMRELQWICQAPPPVGGGDRARTQARGWVLAAIGVLLGGLLGAAAVWWTSRSSEAVAGTAKHFAIALPDGYASLAGLAPQFALSRDGAVVVFAAIVEASLQPVAGGQTDEGSQLFIKRADAPEVVPLPDTERGHSPFLSPDGAWVGFNRDNNMYKIPLKGGPVVRLASANAFSGASWGDDGFIVYSPMHGGGIWRVSDNGGQPEQLTRPDPKQGERGHHQPFVLPGAKAFLFTVEMAGRSHDDARIAVHTMATRESRTLFEGGMGARFVPPGHLVYGRAGQLLAVGFDAVHMQISGTPAAVLAGVRSNPSGGAAEFAIADDGALAYVPGGSFKPRMPLEWVDRNGAVQILPVPPDDYRNPRLSPSMSAIAVQIGGADDDVRIIDLTRNVPQRITFAGDNLAPVWFPSGDRLLFNSDEGGTPALYALAANDPASKQRLTDSGFAIPSSLSPDGSVLAYTEAAEGSTGRDIWTMTLPDRRRRVLVQTPFDEQSPAFSPDGRWLAYVSNEAGRQDVIVARYPDLSQKTLVSPAGGAEPVWLRNGRELYYRQADRMMAVPVTLGARLTVGEPKMLFQVASPSGTFGVPNYDVTADGRFLMIGAPPVSYAATHLNYVVGWAAQLNAP